MDKAIGIVDDSCREKICFPMLGACGITRPRTIITFLFLASSVVVFMAFIGGCVVASDQDLDGTLQ